MVASWDGGMPWKFGKKASGLLFGLWTPSVQTWRSLFAEKPLPTKQSPGAFLPPWPGWLRTWSCCCRRRTFVFQVKNTDFSPNTRASAATSAGDTVTLQSHQLDLKHFVFFTSRIKTCVRWASTHEFKFIAAHFHFIGPSRFTTFPWNCCYNWII